MPKDTISIIQPRGSTLRRKCTAKDIQGKIYDLSVLCTLTFMVKECPEEQEDSSALLTFDVNLSDPENDLVNGIFYLKATATQMDIKAGRYFYDFKGVKMADGKVIKFPSAPGRFIVQDVVNRGTS